MKPASAASIAKPRARKLRMTRSRKEDYLEDHLPYRLRAIDGLAWWCEIILQDIGKWYRMRVSMDEGQVGAHAVTNALSDAGLTHGRAVMEFLGISRDRYGKLKPATRDVANKRDDLWPSDFGLT